MDFHGFYAFLTVFLRSKPKIYDFQRERLFSQGIQGFTDYLEINCFRGLIFHDFLGITTVYTN